MTVAELIEDAKKHCVSKNPVNILAAAMRLNRGAKWKVCGFTQADVLEEFYKHYPAYKDPRLLPGQMW